MRSSLQAGPSIKYEVVNLQAGFSDILDGGLKYCTYLSFNVSRLLRYPKTEEPAKRLTTLYFIEGPAWRLLLIKSEEPAWRLTTSYFIEGPAWRLLLIKSEEPAHIL